MPLDPPPASDMSHDPGPAIPGAPDPPRVLLFDLDGTLVATRRLYLESFADALEPVLGRRPDPDEMIALRPRSERRFLRELGGDEAHPEVMERFYRAYQTRHERDFEGVYRGVPEMLGRLRTLEFPMGLVTGKSRLSWQVTGPRVGLGDWAVEVFDEDVPASKPDPAGLVLALERLGRAPEEAVYLGDTFTDLEAAHRAGVRPAAVLWSKRPHERDPFRQRALELGGLVFHAPDAVSAYFVDGIRGATERAEWASRATDR
jgi:pyrophosphatase PpaX